MSFILGLILGIFISQPIDTPTIKHCSGWGAIQEKLPDTFKSIGNGFYSDGIITRTASTTFKCKD